jgi:phosphotriesterase-related protein
MTVRGPVDPGVVGWTSMHDHVFWDSATWWAPETFEDPELTDRPLDVRTAGLARWNALGIRDNLVMDPEDYDAQRDEVAEFAAAGGTCLVDPTCEGLAPQPLLLRRMAGELDLNIVAGAGIYVHHAHPPWVEDATVDEVEAFITGQVDVGLAGTDVRPGLIGEVGSSNPVTDRELKVLRAAARVGVRTGTAVSVHMTAPGQHGRQVVDCLIAEGLDPARIVLCHMDEVLDLPYHLSLLERGVTVEMDTFGFEGYFARLWKTPSDTEKMDLLAELVRRGFAGQIVLGHDVALKCQLKRFGGLGYDHIPRRIAPTLINHLGLARDDVEALLADNPRRLLTREGPGSGSGASA